MSNEVQTTTDATTTVQVVAQPPLLAESLNLIGLTDTAKKFAIAIVSLAKASTENTLAMCEAYYQAKSALGSEFSALCAAISHDENSSTIKKYILIGRNAERFKPYLDRLPNTWTTLYELTRLDRSEFQQLIEHGKINQLTTGAEVKSILKHREGRTTKTKSATKTADATPLPEIMGYALQFDELPSQRQIFEFEDAILRLIQDHGLHCRVLRTDGFDAFLTRDQKQGN